MVDLKAAVGPNPPASCLQCHSADYRIAPDNAKPTGTEAKYGITCVGCHTPHPAATANTSKGVWDEAFTTQLVGNPSNPSDLCTTCHNSQVGDGVIAAGTTVYENQKEVMNGTGAIVPIYQAGAGMSGSFVKCITVKALQSTNPGMIRLFISPPGGSPQYILFQEKMVVERGKGLIKKCNSKKPTSYSRMHL